MKSSGKADRIEEREEYEIGSGGSKIENKRPRTG